MLSTHYCEKSPEKHETRKCAESFACIYYLQQRGTWGQLSRLPDPEFQWGSLTGSPAVDSPSPLELPTKTSLVVEDLKSPSPLYIPCEPILAWGPRFFLKTKWVQNVYRDQLQSLEVARESLEAIFFCTFMGGRNKWILENCPELVISQNLRWRDQATHRHSSQMLHDIWCLPPLTSPTYVWAHSRWRFTSVQGAPIGYQCWWLRSECLKK